MSDGNTTMQVEAWLEPLRSPDSAEGRRARDELIEHTRRRMEAMCPKMFFGSLRDVGVVDWEDVYQEAAIKLWKALDDIKPTRSPPARGSSSGWRPRKSAKCRSTCAANTSATSRRSTATREARSAR